MEEDLIIAYLNTDYQVDGLEKPIRVGQINTELDLFCTRSGFQNWAFITAWNPLSVPLSDKENQIRNEMLKSDLSTNSIFSGRGQDSEGVWPPEESFFIPGINLSEAIELGRKYGQRAIVAGTVGLKASLIETLDFEGNTTIQFWPKENGLSVEPGFGYAQARAPEK